MAWNQDGYTGDKRTQAAQMAKDDIEKTWGGTAYTRVTDPLPDLIPNLNVQVALVRRKTYGWTVTTLFPWVTEDGELVPDNAGSGVGTGFATEADAVAVAQALVKADWS